MKSTCSIQQVRALKPPACLITNYQKQSILTPVKDTYWVEFIFTLKLSMISHQNSSGRCLSRFCYLIIQQMPSNCGIWKLVQENISKHMPQKIFYVPGEYWIIRQPLRSGATTCFNVVFKWLSAIPLPLPSWVVLSGCVQLFEKKRFLLFLPDSRFV